MASQDFHATPGGNPRATRLQVFTRIIDAIAGTEPAAHLQDNPQLSLWRQCQPNLWAGSLAAFNQWKDEDLKKLIEANIDWPTKEDPVRHMHRFLADLAEPCVPPCLARGDSLYTAGYFTDTIMYDAEGHYAPEDIASLEKVWKHTAQVIRAAIAWLRPAWTTPLRLRSYELHRLV